MLVSAGRTCLDPMAGIICQTFRRHAPGKKEIHLKMFLMASLAVIFAMGVMVMKASETNLPALKLIASKRPLVIGHRGYCQFAPENTLPSFKLAMAAGADLVELDYYHSKDGQLIVIHDSELDRNTDATNHWPQKRIKVASITAAELQ